MRKPGKRVDGRRRSPYGVEEGDVRVSTDAELQEALTKTDWGKTYLTEFLVSAEQNTKITYLKRKGYFDLFNSLGELFERASGVVNYRDKSTLAGCMLFNRTVGSFFGAVRLGSSGQLPECYTQLRVCLESALYAFGIYKEAGLGEVWLNRHVDEESQRLCRKRFQVGNLFQKLAAEQKSLQEEAEDLYDECIDRGAHPNERSVTANIKFSRSDKKIALELFNTEPGVFEACLAVCCLVATCVINIFRLIYPGKFKELNADVRVLNMKTQLQRIAPGIVAELRKQEVK
jgi:hypothetical protein